MNVTLGQLHAFNPTIFEAPVLTSRKYKLIALASKIIGPQATSRGSMNKTRDNEIFLGCKISKATVGWDKRTKTTCKPFHGL